MELELFVFFRLVIVLTIPQELHNVCEWHQSIHVTPDRKANTEITKNIALIIVFQLRFNSSGNYTVTAYDIDCGLFFIFFAEHRRQKSEYIAD